MAWFDKNKDEEILLPSIEAFSVELPAISKYYEALRLPELFKDFNVDAFPVIDIDGSIIGIVSEYDLAKVISEWSIEQDSYEHSLKVEDIMVKTVWTEQYTENLKNLLPKIADMHARIIPLVNKNNIYTGFSITRKALISFLTRKVKPLTLGGLATPLGVYITDGRNQAGVGNFALFLTGFSLALVIALSQYIGFLMFKYIKIIPAFQLLIEIFIFIIILKFTPLVKFHAAEHQTINAIEAGLPLIPEVIKRQRREHKRCGTNLMALIIGIQFVLFLAVEAEKISSFYKFIVLAVGFIFVFSNWHKIGMWIQKYFTTKDAEDFYINSGIKAGIEILKKNKEDKNPNSPSFSEKLWTMGLFQILAGFFAVFSIINYLLTLP